MVSICQSMSRPNKMFKMKCLTNIVIGLVNRKERKLQKNTDWDDHVECPFIKGIINIKLHIPRPSHKQCEEIHKLAQKYENDTVFCYRVLFFVFHYTDFTFGKVRNSFYDTIWRMVHS